MNFKKREELGAEIFRKGFVVPTNQSLYQVRSSLHKRPYLVSWVKRKWTCTCRDFEKSGRRCKHVLGVLCHIQTRRAVTTLDAESSSVPRCPICKSERLKKRGLRYNRAGKKQTYECLHCGARFVEASIETLKTEAVVALAALDLYFRGLSLRQTAEHLEMIWKRKVSYASVLNWIRKFVGIAEKSMGRRLPRSPERWNADESAVRLNGRHIQLWTLLDPDSRYLIAVQVTRRRRRREATTMMEKGRKVAGLPWEVVTDGLGSYAPAVEDVLGRRRGLIHVQGPGLSRGQNNNRLERLNGSIKRRVRPMGAFRSMKGAKTFATGYRIYHNFIKPHRALGGKTPAEAVGLAKGKLGWGDLISRKRHRPRNR